MKKENINTKHILQLRLISFLNWNYTSFLLLLMAVLIIGPIADWEINQVIVHCIR